MKVQLYNRENVYSYAKKWALKRNPKYYNFDSLGGDCTNFVSQCVYAGSSIMNFTKDLGWYYRSLSDRAPQLFCKIHNTATRVNALRNKISTISTKIGRAHV